MKLQLALDDITLEAALALLKDVSPFVDIIEAGTPFVLEYGMEAVRALRQMFPDKEILCDAKIMDGGALEANSAFQAGADYVTVLGVTDAATIQAVTHAARENRKHTVVDLLCVEDFAKSIPTLEAMGVDLVAVHVGVDQQRSGRTPLKDLAALKGLVTSARVAVAGGISSATLPAYLALKPDIVIVGGAILHAAHPAAEAEQLARLIREAE